MAQQLPLQPLYQQAQQPQMQSEMPDFVNDPNIDINTKRQLLNQYHQSQQQPQVVADVSPQSMAVAGANRQGVDWAGLLGSLGSYVSTAGSAYGTGANPSQGLLNAANATQKHTQNINQYNNMAPKYQQMGYDVSGYDPRRGGAGLTATPEKMIELESLIDQRDINNRYRQQMIESQQQKQDAVPTINDLMLYSPEFRATMNAQYDFKNGANAGILNRPVPKELLMNVMPKNVNMNYSGGLKSSKTSTSIIEHKSKDKPSKPVKPTATPTLKEGQTGNYNGKKVIVRNGAWQYQ